MIEMTTASSAKPRWPMHGQGEFSSHEALMKVGCDNAGQNATATATVTATATAAAAWHCNEE